MQLDGPGIEYSLEQFEADTENMKPRFFDNYILAPFMVWYGMSSKTPMGRWPRRLLFTSGVYMVMRNLKQYREGVASLQARLASAQSTSEIVSTTLQ